MKAITKRVEKLEAAAAEAALRQMRTYVASRFALTVEVLASAVERDEHLDLAVRASPRSGDGPASDLLVAGLPDSPPADLSGYVAGDRLVVHGSRRLRDGSAPRVDDGAWRIWTDRVHVESESDRAECPDCQAAKTVLDARLREFAKFGL